MTESMTWFLVAGLLVIVELFIGTFYLLMVAAGIAAGGVAASLDATLPMQAATAAIVGVVGTLLLRRRGKKARISAQRDPNISLDIGQRVTIAKWHDGRARVTYRGALWDVELAPGVEPVGGSFTIREIRGSRLIVH
jgi:membrane protein implicated in regulation of membrane protease activity